MDGGRWVVDTRYRTSVDAGAGINGGDGEGDDEGWAQQDDDDDEVMMNRWTPDGQMDGRMDGDDAIRCIADGLEF